LRSKIEQRLSVVLLSKSDASSGVLQKVRRVADYQFGIAVGSSLFPDGVVIVLSKRTGRIRHVYFGGELLATLRPRDGLFSLTIEGAKRLMGSLGDRRMWVRVQEEAVASVGKGGDVFARHVVDVDEEIRPREEVAVLDGKDRVVAVGKAMLSGREMRDFGRGVAVRVRKGWLEKVKKEKETILGGQGM
jgi:predicted RNA-binding protein (TIGR00451 family)